MYYSTREFILKYWGENTFKMIVELFQILNVTYMKIILRYFFGLTKRKMTFVKFLKKSIDLINGTF